MSIGVHMSNLHFVVGQSVRKERERGGGRESEREKEEGS